MARHYSILHISEMVQDSVIVTVDKEITHALFNVVISNDLE